ncbi:MAG: cell envelope integrity protein TolA [Nitrospira sp.]|nr:cell envelope integrity protein TolA [Nitrospira sp.]
MKMNRWQSVVVVVCCVVISGCTTSRWVTDSRKEVISEKTASTVVPLLSITQYPEDKPEVIVKLSKRLVGTLEVQEQQHEVIHTIWGTSLGNVLSGWLLLPFSPIALINYTIYGAPGEGVMAVVNSFLAATGFNAPPGSYFHVKDRYGESRIDKTFGGAGMQEIPWVDGSLTITTGNHEPLRVFQNAQGLVAIDLKRLPIDLVHPNNDLHLTITAKDGGSEVEAQVNVTVATMLAWPAKEAEFARREQERQVELARQERERKAQEEREAIAKREREAQQKREAVARREQERREKEAERERRAEERAESDANMALMMQGIGLLGQIAAAQQQNSMASRPSVPTPRTVPPPSAALQSLSQMAGALANTPDMGGGSSPSQESGGNSSGSNAASQYRHNPANDASRCLVVKKGTGLFSFDFQNNCGFPVEILSCTNSQEKPNHCQREGYTQRTGKVASGTRTPLSVWGGGKPTSWEYGACKYGTMRYTSDMNLRREYACVD